MSYSKQKEFEQLRIEKTKEYFKALCLPVATMTCPPPQPKILQCSGAHVNVGEWAEVDHCYSVGICSDGGIGIVTKFESGKADVRYPIPNPYRIPNPNPNPNPYPNP